MNEKIYSMPSSPPFLVERSVRQCIYYTIFRQIKQYLFFFWQVHCSLLFHLKNGISKKWIISWDFASKMCEYQVDFAAKTCYTKREYRTDGIITNIPLYLANRAKELLWYQEIRKAGLKACFSYFICCGCSSSCIWWLHEQVVRKPQEVRQIVHPRELPLSGFAFSVHMYLISFVVTIIIAPILLYVNIYWIYIKWSSNRPFPFSLNYRVKENEPYYAGKNSLHFKMIQRIIFMIINYSVFITSLHMI